MEELIARGAESVILKVERWNQYFVLKWRQSKPYLFTDIDAQLRKTRTSRECKMLSVARSLGVRTPAVYAVNLDSYTILMDYIDGTQFKQLVNTLTENQLKEFCLKFGQLIALLHKGDVVHGDPTTSNLIIDSKSQLWLVDFGLSEMNATVEMKGVDLHLIHRALETTHWDLQENMLQSTIKGYTDTLGDDAKDILSRMEEIRERGRYH
ncbi:MAG: Kae1-associated serine/threonine protein kinase [Candidatus Thorarchaeota archaeon]|nr:Kae1-associated serine/threonine protein kinase [Candidatus Thorarchaeota archaeon]